MRFGSRNIVKLGSIRLQPHRVISFDFYLFIKVLRQGVKFSKKFGYLFYNHMGMVPNYNKKIIKGIFF